MRRALLLSTLLLVPASSASCGNGTPEGAPAAGPAAAATTGGDARFPAQPGWIVEPPSSSMRVAQFRLPGSGGAGDAELAVFSFPGGGSVESNLDRWAAQFEQPDGADARAAATTTRVERDGMTVHRIEVGGTYVAETTPGSGQRLNHPGWKLIGAVVEGPTGMHFVKCVGPAATVDAWRASVDAFLGAVRP